MRCNNKKSKCCFAISTMNTPYSFLHVWIPSRYEHFNAVYSNLLDVSVYALYSLYTRVEIPDPSMKVMYYRFAADRSMITGIREIITSWWSQAQRKCSSLRFYLEMWEATKTPRKREYLLRFKQSTKEKEKNGLPQSSTKSSQSTYASSRISGC